MNRRQLQGNLEKSLILVIFIFFWAGSSRYLYLNFFSTWSDAAGFVSLAEKIRTGHGMLSPMYNAGTWFFEISSKTNTEVWCQFPSVNRFENFSRWHPYLILYPIGFLTNLLGTNSLVILSALTAVSYMIIPLTTYFFLRNHAKVKILNALILVLFFLCFPSWNHGFEGQLQSDRLFIGISFLITYLILSHSFRFASKAEYLFIVLGSVSAILISERAAVYIVLIFVVVLLRGLITRNSIHIFLSTFILILALGYFIYWKIKIENSTYYEKTSVAYFINSFIGSFKDPILTKSVIFLLVLFPFFMFARKNIYSLILFVLICLPQFIWTTGGSEKIGFTTQYHAGYTGVLLGLTLYAVVNHKVANGWNIEKSIFIPIAYITLITVSTVWSGISQYNLTPLKLVNFVGLNPDKFDELSEIKDSRMSLVNRIPKNTWISAPEKIMPALTFSGHHNVDYFPFGSSINKYLILNKDSNGNYEPISPWLTSLLPDKDTDRKSVLKCLHNNVEKTTLVYSEVNEFDSFEIRKNLNPEAYKTFP